MHHEVVGPLLDIVALENEGICAKAHLDEVVGQLSGLETKVHIEPLADLKSLGWLLLVASI